MASDPDKQGTVGGLRAVWRLFFSRRTPTWAKIFFSLAALAYLAFPVDALPDFLFPVGLLDDALVFPVLMWVATWFATGREEASTEPAAGERPRKTVKNEAPRKTPPGDEASPRADDPPIDERGPGMRRSI